MRYIVSLLILSLCIPARGADAGSVRPAAQKAAATYLNPVLGGYWADPSVVRDGEDYYLTTSSHPLYPGMTIFHSKDLVNWAPVSYALDKYYGVVLAPEMVRYGDWFYIYFSVNARRDWNNPREGNETFVTRARRPEGPWSEPVKFDISPRLFDPGHVADANGKRWLYFAKGMALELSADGMSAVGEPRQVYQGWQYPTEWIDQTFALEGPKFTKLGDYYYMIVAEGGSHGPPTSHMVAVARSKNPLGPWENSPHNPMVRTFKNSERWWSKGHGTLVDTPDGRWYIVYHAYENGFYTLGRQVLIEPVKFTPDGWPVLTEGLDAADLPTPMPFKGTVQKPYVQADLPAFRIGLDWWFYHQLDHARYRVDGGTLTLRCQGTTPADSHPLLFNAGVHAYQFEVSLTLAQGSEAGVVVFYDEVAYAGMGVRDDRLVYFDKGGAGSVHSKSIPVQGGKVRLRLLNDRNFVTVYYSLGGEWIKAPFRTVDVTSFHQNVYGKSQALMPGIYAAGKGEVQFSNVEYKVLD